MASLVYIPITDEDESEMKISSDEVENKENKATAIWKERYHFTLSLFLWPHLLPYLPALICPCDPCTSDLDFDAEGLFMKKS